MNKSGDPGPGRRLAQGCVDDDWFDGPNLTLNPDSAPRKRYAAAPLASVQASQVVGSGMFSAARVGRNLRPGQIGFSGDAVEARAGVGRDPESIGGIKARDLAEVLDRELELRMGRRGIVGQVARVLGQARAERVGQTAVGRLGGVVARHGIAVGARAGDRLVRGHSSDNHRGSRLAEGR